MWRKREKTRAGLCVQTTPDPQPGGYPKLWGLEGSRAEGHIERGQVAVLRRFSLLTG